MRSTHTHEFDDTMRTPRERDGRGGPRRGGGHRGGPRRGRHGGEHWGDFGPGMRMPREGRGPRRGRRGDVRNVILALLDEEPMNGYQIIKAVAERTDGLWRPGPGSVYPALGLLEDEGLIEPQDGAGKGRKVFALTEDGATYVKEHSEELADPFEKMVSPHTALLDSRRELAALGMAVHQVALAGDPTQVAEAKALLEQTRKSIYRILAGDAAEPQD